MQPAIESERLNDIGCIVEARFGLQFAGARRSELAAKVGQARRKAGDPSTIDYLAALSSPGGHPWLDELMETLTVGETYFFRHRPYFELVRGGILPEMLGQVRRTELRVWCAGCATGEEAYSIAILFHEMRPRLNGRHISILGSDINRRFLALAESGLYSDWSFRETDEPFRETYFKRAGKRFQIRDEIRRMVRFGCHNLLEGGPPSCVGEAGGFDLVFCRNVLIYFAPEQATRIIASLERTLVPGGCLVLGPSDPTPGPSSTMDALLGQDAVVYIRRTSPSCQVWEDAAACAKESRDQPHTVPRGCASATAAPADKTELSAVDGDWRACCRLARGSAGRGRFEEAAAHCQAAISRAQLEPEPYYLLATLYEAQGEEHKALAAFRQAVYLDRDFAPAYLGMAAIYRRGGRSQLAQRELARAQRSLARRAPDEVVLADEGLTAGRLREAVGRALAGRYERANL